MDLRPDAPLVGRLVSVEPVEERHRDGLRAALEESPELMRFMPYPGFDRWFAYALAVETDADGHAAYEAHMTKSDGTPVTVYVDKSFAVVSVETR